MSVKPPNDVNTRHRFLDEAGDTVFYGRHGVPIIGVKENVSLCFILGMAKVRSDLQTIRNEIIMLESEIVADPYYKGVPSIQKRQTESGGYFFHANNDPQEVRKTFFEYLQTLDFSFEAVVGRKIPSLFINKHNKKETEFYADMLSHLLKNKLAAGGDLILNVAERGNSTKNITLSTALVKATDRFLKKNENGAVRTKVAFNVQNPRTEPILCIADYLCWAVQRVFERGETRYYDYLQEKISLVVDVYDSVHYSGSKNYYTEKNPLTPINKLSPPSY